MIRILDLFHCYNCHDISWHLSCLQEDWPAANICELLLMHVLRWFHDDPDRHRVIMQLVDRGCPVANVAAAVADVGLSCAMHWAGRGSELGSMPLDPNDINDFGAVLLAIVVSSPHGEWCRSMIAQLALRGAPMDKAIQKFQNDSPATLSAEGFRILFRYGRTDALVRLFGKFDFGDADDLQLPGLKHEIVSEHWVAYKRLSLWHECGLLGPLAADLTLALGQQKCFLDESENLSDDETSQRSGIHMCQGLLLIFAEQKLRAARHLAKIFRGHVIDVNVMRRRVLPFIIDGIASDPLASMGSPNRRFPDGGVYTWPQCVDYFKDECGQNLAYAFEQWDEATPEAIEDVQVAHSKSA